MLVKLLIAGLIHFQGLARASDTPIALPAPSARWAELADPVFQTLTLDHGLPNLSVTTMAEDRNGFLWVGTQDGLARWDGYRFRVYQPNTKQTGALRDGLVQALQIDRQGRLWVGTANGGVARYESEKDQFLSLPISADGISHPNIRKFVDDGGDGLWVVGKGGLVHIDTLTDKVTQFRHDAKDITSIPDDNVSAVMIDRKGNLWVGTRKGLVRRDANAKGNGGFDPIAVPFPSGASHSIISLLETGDGRIWIGGNQTGLFFIAPATGFAQRLPESDAASASIKNEVIFTLIETAGGEIWAGTFTHGIAAIDLNTLRARLIRHDPSMPTSLPNDSVSAMLRDRSGLVWIGTQRGLARHDLQQTALLTVFGASNRQVGLSQPDAASVTQTGDGKILIGFGISGADIVSPTGGKKTPLQIESTILLPAGQKAENATISHLASTKSPDGTIFLGTSHGLFRVDPSGALMSPVAIPPRSGSPAIQSMLADSVHLWIGGIRDGLWVLDLTAGRATMPRRAPGTEILKDEHIVSLARVDGATLWIGTANGLYFYNIVSHVIERILANPSDESALPANSISAIFLDRQNRLWVGTFGGGISLLLSRDAKRQLRFRRFGIAQGLPNTNINKMLDDADGRIWISTDNGMAILDPTTFKIQALGKADGVAIPAYRVGAGTKTEEGELLFGGAGGLTVVRPDRYRPWKYQPPLAITEVRVQGKPILSNRFNGRADKSETLTIEPDANGFGVEFSSLDYSAPERNRYAYRLDGYDKEWIDTDPVRRLAAYTNLPPGDYRLRLRGSNRNGTWTEKELVLPIHVVPAWYQTWWIHLIEMVAAAAAIYALVQVRTNFLRKRQRELQGQVDERTIELIEKNKELARVNARQEVEQSELTRFLAVASHDLRQPMHALSLYLGVLNNFDIPESAKPVLRSANQCAQIMDEMFLALLDLSRLDAQIVDPLIERFPVATLLSNIEIEFAPQAAAKGLTLRVARCSYWIESDNSLVEQILRNFTANALRYTESGTILIGCRRRDSMLRLAVFDTGKGISAEHQHSVFDEFCQIENASRDRTKGLGLGLAIVRRLAKLLSAPVTLVSTLGKGSMFAIDLPRADKPLPASQREQRSSASDLDPMAAQQTLASKLIVIVEDEENILDAMRILLEQWKCTVVTAASGDEAIRKLSDSARIPDALVCDYRLRLNETGLDVIYALQEEFNHPIPALIITGTITTEQIHEMAMLGMPILHKPMTAAVLQDAIVRLITPP